MNTHMTPKGRPDAAFALRAPDRTPIPGGWIACPARILIAALLLAAAVCGCVTDKPNSSPVLQNRKVHRETGIVFPATVGGFSRGEVKLYDAEGADMSAGYDLADPACQVAITVYVYPGPRLISIGSPPAVIATARKHLTDGHFEQVKREVLKYHPHAAAVSDQESSMAFRGQSLYGRIATFKSVEIFAWRTQAIVTQAEVYACGRWIIKYRITYPAALEQAAAESVHAFKKAFIQQNEMSERPSFQR